MASPPFIKSTRFILPSINIAGTKTTVNKASIIPIANIFNNNINDISSVFDKT